MWRMSFHNVMKLQSFPTYFKMKVWFLQSNLTIEFIILSLLKKWLSFQILGKEKKNFSKMKIFKEHLFIPLWKQNLFSNIVKRIYHLFIIKNTETSPFLKSKARKLNYLDWYEKFSFSFILITECMIFSLLDNRKTNFF